jgi:hypothetical protein
MIQREFALSFCVKHRGRVVMSGDHGVSWTPCTSCSAAALVSRLVNAAKEVILIVRPAIVLKGWRSICGFLFSYFFLNHNYLVWLFFSYIINDSTFFVSLSPDPVHLCF